MEGIFVMIDLVEIEYVQINNNKEYELIIRKVLKQCFEVEKIDRSSLYVNIILTTPDVIRKYNKKYRNNLRHFFFLAFFEDFFFKLFIFLFCTAIVIGSKIANCKGKYKSLEYCCF